MAFEETKKPQKALGLPLPPIPEKCMVADCSKDTDVQVLLIRDKNGKQIAAMDSRRPGETIWRFVEKKSDEYHLRPEWKFDQWVTRCGECYAYDVERYKGNQV